MCKPIEFQQWLCTVEKTTYKDNNRTALVLKDSYDDDEVAIATVNIPNYPLKDDEVIIKDYSENEGMLEILMKAEIVSAPIDYVQQGHVLFPICKLLI